MHRLGRDFLWSDSDIACRLKEVKQGELELEVTWYSVLDQQNSP